jgi:hypothetical protein
LIDSNDDDNSDEERARSGEGWYRKTGERREGRIKGGERE